MGILQPMLQRLQVTYMSTILRRMQKREKKCLIKSFHKMEREVYLMSERTKKFEKNFEHKKFFGIMDINIDRI